MSTSSIPPAQPSAPAGRHVSLLALPEAVVSTLAGIYDVMNARALMGAPAAASSAPPFRAGVKGRHPALVDWLRRMHERSAVLCSACSDLFLLAEAGPFDGKDATVHFVYAREFESAHPSVTVHPERVLVISGPREEPVSSGASTTWHDMVLYLIVRHDGATGAQEVARMYALQWHQDGLAPQNHLRGPARPR
jgi:transcriptional regulator GlxA family with amidase domain